MNDTLTDPLAESRESVRAFAEHYNYDVSYMEALMDASPDAYKAFESAMVTGRFHKVAPIELMAIAKMAALRAEDCGPCLELGVKMAREAGISESVIRGSIQGGRGLSQEQLDVYRYATAVATNEEMDPELLPRLEERWGREVVAELAVAIVGARIYPTMKRALGYAKSCSLIPGLLS